MLSGCRMELSYVISLNSTRWGDGVTPCVKIAPFALLEVVQEKAGSWSVYRNSKYRLLRDGKPATFATLEEAQRAADAHQHDGRLDSEVKRDGLSWDTEPWIAE
jgi:hypothetical protein